MVPLSKPSSKRTQFYYPGKPARRAIPTPRARILRASAPILVRDSSARSAADATAAVIVEVSADAVDAPRGAPIVRIAVEIVIVVATVARIGARIAARIGAVIAAVDASSAALVAMARIAATRLHAGLN
jgi:hypothetical protein